jgi:WD40 repeat protein
MISETPFTPPKLQKRTLKGHSKAVLCIAHSSERIAYIPKPNHTENNGVTHPSLLLSGSEDGTARLWDLRTRKTAYCMVVPKSKEGEILEVASVAFHPSIYDNDTCKEGQAAGEPNDLVLNGSSDCTV